MDLAKLSSLCGVAGNQHTVLAAALDSAAPMLDVHHPFRAMLGAVAWTTLNVTEVRMLRAAFGSTRLEFSSGCAEEVQVLDKMNDVAIEGGVRRTGGALVADSYCKRGNVVDDFV